MLAVTSAKIIDTCCNRGGSPETVVYMCCLFFPASTPINLNDVHNQITDETRGFWTQTDPPRRRLPEQAGLRTISKQTFSGGVELDYNI